MESSAYATLPVPVISIPAPGIWRAGVISFARRTALKVLGKGIRQGSLQLVDSASGTHTFGPSATEKGRTVTLYVTSEHFWLRVLFGSDLGFSEAYMAGECDSDNLKEVLNLYVDNLRFLSRLDSIIYKLFDSLDTIRHVLSHGHNKSIANVAGYDASNDLYKAFLSKEMQYSNPIWSADEGGVRGDLEGRNEPLDLESAQRNKIKYILRKACLKPGDRLLEIGSGWGSIAIAAAEMGCQVDTITLSIEQKVLAEERIAQAGFSSKIRVHFMDYRDMPKEWEKSFDACVSLEMLEAVGVEYMPTFMRMLDWALKNDRAAFVLTATTYPENKQRRFQGNDFVRKYHWPHTILPTATSLAQDMSKVLKGRIRLESIEDFGTHYPRCLREWKRRLEANWKQPLIESLQSRYPELKDPYRLEMFRRKWIYMFTYMEVAYSRVWLSNVCWTFMRPWNPSALSA